MQFRLSYRVALQETDCAFELVLQRGNPQYPAVEPRQMFAAAQSL
jgi:hypothetical protein